MGGGWEQPRKVSDRHLRSRKRAERGVVASSALMDEADDDSGVVWGLAHAEEDFAKMHSESHVHNLTPQEKKLMFSYESLDYDAPVNSLYEREVKGGKWALKKVQIAKWIVFTFIGITTGTLAYVLSRGVEFFTELKRDYALELIQDKDLPSAYLYYLGVSLAYVSIAAFLVAIVEPVAGGSGIPEIKGYLNGTNYQRFLRLKTLVCKAVGVVFSVSGGLIIGKEGPLVHSGAVFAANISHLTGFGKLGLKEKWRGAMLFRNDRSKRDFVAGGAAAGVAAAFGAPVGGILFSLEEAASFWSTQLTWMVFLCSMLGTFVLNLFKIGGGTGYSGLISFGPPLTESPFHVWETPFFILLAVFGGLMGATFNHFNERICRWRRDTLQGRRLPRFTEALIVCAITATCAFWAPHFFRDCADVTAADKKFQDKYHLTLYEQYTCEDGQFNTMATVLFSTTEESIRGFFHNTGEYSIASLGIYFVLVFMLAVVTYGIAVPSGLFVPCILMGCGFGRLVGELVRAWFGTAYDINPGSYAVMGATAALGGVARMTISLTVILLETTQDVQFITPIMLVLMVSKWVGDLFNISLYDLHVELKCMPFVESAPSANMFHMKVKDVMQSPVQMFLPVVTVEDALKTLESSAHNGFPVVNSKEQGHFIGMILRNQIAIMIRHHAFGPYPQEKLSLIDFSTTLSSKYERLPSREEIHPHLHRELHFGPLMNPVPITVQANCPLSRVYVLFRSLGIRHLVVTSETNEPVGIITRKDIMSSFDQDLF